MTMSRMWLLLMLGGCGALAQEERTPIFGTTVYSTTGLAGKIYFIPKGSEILPNFKKLKPKGTVYTTRLNIQPREFSEGFPGISDRFEWFAIQYTGHIWVEEAGRFEFALTSDDGSKLHIDDKMVIYNDGTHAPVTETGSVELKAGLHSIRVSYFQGPRMMIALVLGVRRPGQRMRIFDTRDFLPPPEKEAEYRRQLEAAEARQKGRR